MKKTYRKLRNYRKTHKSRKLHKSLNVQTGGNYNYELKISSDSEVVFITHKTKPYTLYKIDLPSKTFTIFTTTPPYEIYPLEEKYNRTLFLILSDAKRNDTVFDELLTTHGINNIEYYPRHSYYSYYKKKVEDKPKTYKHVLHKIEEVDEESLKPSPIQVVKELPLSPHSPNSPNNKTMRRNRRKESIVAAMQFADVAPIKQHVSSDNPKNIRVKLNASSNRPHVPELRLSSNGRRIPSKQ